jgi:hypothetical protein
MVGDDHTSERLFEQFDVVFQGERFKKSEEGVIE